MGHRGDCRVEATIIDLIDYVENRTELEFIDCDLLFLEIDDLRTVAWDETTQVFLHNQIIVYQRVKMELVRLLMD